jgi:hypothetical protein
MQVTGRHPRTLQLGGMVHAAGLSPALGGKVLVQHSCKVKFTKNEFNCDSPRIWAEGAVNPAVLCDSRFTPSMPMSLPTREASIPLSCVAFALVPPTVGFAKCERIVASAAQSMSGFFVQSPLKALGIVKPVLPRLGKTVAGSGNQSNSAEDRRIPLIDESLIGPLVRRHTGVVEGQQFIPHGVRRDVLSKLSLGVITIAVIGQDHLRRCGGGPRDGDGDERGVCAIPRGERRQERLPGALIRGVPRQRKLGAVARFHEPFEGGFPAGARRRLNG